jgi:DNA-binding NarL/FixJ family response regulator
MAIIDQAQIRIVLADDFPLIRSGIRKALSQLPMLKIVAEATNGSEAIEFCKTFNPDILILDMEMPILSGIDVACYLQINYPAIRILALSAHNDPYYIQEILKLGAYGYIMKDEAVEFIMEAVCGVIKGERGWFSRNVKSTVSELMMGEKNRCGLNLSPREKEVLIGITEGLTNQNIALSLGLSPKTVEKHIVNLYLKLNVSSRVEAAVYAVRNNLINKPRLA